MLQSQADAFIPSFSIGARNQLRFSWLAASHFEEVVTSGRNLLFPTCATYLTAPRLLSLLFTPGHHDTTLLCTVPGTLIHLFSMSFMPCNLSLEHQKKMHFVTHIHNIKALCSRKTLVITLSSLRTNLLPNTIKPGLSPHTYGVFPFHSGELGATWVSQNML